MTTIAPWGMKQPNLAPIAEQVIAEISARRSISPAAWLRGDSGYSSGELSMACAERQSVWIYSCVTAIAENLANMPFRFSQGERGGEDIIETGDLVSLFERPHPDLNRYDFWEYIVSWLLLRGRCFIVGLDKGNRVINWTDKQKPYQLLVLSPDHFRKNCEAGFLISWTYTAGYDEPFYSYEFIPDELIYIRLPGIADFWEGQNPLFVALLAAQTDYAAAQFMKGLMMNNADQGMVVSTEQKLVGDQREQIEAALRNRKRMAGRADKPLILEGGLKVEKPAVTNADLQFLENRKFSRQEICAVYRVPQEILGYTEDANRSVADAARLNFIEGRVIPLGERLEVSMDPIVKKFGPDLWGWFDPEALPIMQKARRDRYTGAVSAFGIGVPIDVCNQVFDLGLPGDLPHAGKSFLPFSLQELGAPEPAAAPLPAPVDENQPAKILGRLLRKFKEPHICAGPSSQAYEAAQAGSVRLKEGRLRRFWWDQRGRVIEKLKELYGSKEGHGLHGFSRNKTESVPIGEIRVLEDIINLAQENKVLWQKLAPLIRGDFDFGVAQIGKEVGIDDFAIPPARGIHYIQQRENQIKDINQTTFDQLKNSLADGLKAGEPMDDLIDRVKDVFKTATDSRAQTIAITETNMAVNGGRHGGMQAAGVPKKGWRTSHLENTRPAHIQAEKDYTKGIPVNEAFIVDGEALQYPGDPNGSAGNIINCRCFTYAILEDAPHPSGELVGMRVTAGTDCATRFLTFEEWAGKRAHLTYGASEGSGGNSGAEA